MTICKPGISKTECTIGLTIILILFIIMCGFALIIIYFKNRNINRNINRNNNRLESISIAGANINEYV